MFIRDIQHNIEDLDKSYLIYCIENIITRKQYVGQTLRPLKYRIRAHIYNFPQLAKEDLEKYGLKSFKVYILEYNPDPKELNKLEGIWTDKLNTVGEGNGYNKIRGGSGSLPLTEERKKQYSEKSKTQKANLGKKWSDEYKKNMSDVKKGVKFTNEHKTRMCKANWKLAINNHIKRLSASPTLTLSPVTNNHEFELFKQHVTFWNKSYPVYTQQLM